MLVPAESLTAVGWLSPSDSTVVLARDGGVMFLTLAIINWFGRNATGTPLHALIWANLFARVAGGVANAWEFAVGLTPASVGPVLAAAIAVDILLIVMFAMALRQAQQTRI